VYLFYRFNSGRKEILFSGISNLKLLPGIAFLYSVCSKYTLAKVAVINSLLSKVRESLDRNFTDFCGYNFGICSINLSMRSNFFLFRPIRFWCLIISLGLLSFLMTFAPGSAFGFFC